MANHSTDTPTQRATQSPGGLSARATHTPAGAHSPRDEEQERRVGHWRAWLLATFRPHFVINAQTREITRVRWSEWSDELGINYQTVRNWFELGTAPDVESVTRLARHLGVLPQAILFHSGRISLDDLAAYIGPQPLDLIEDEEYQQAEAALAYTQDEREREWERRHLAESLEHTHRLKQLLRPSSREEWLALRDELRSPVGQMRLRAEAEGPAATSALEDAVRAQPPTSWYLPAEFTAEGRQIDLTPPLVRRRRSRPTTPTPTPPTARAGG